MSIYASAAVSLASLAAFSAFLRFVSSVINRATVLRACLIRFGFSIAETACANFNLVRAAFSSAIWATKSSVDNSTISEFFIFIKLCRMPSSAYSAVNTPRRLTGNGGKPNAGSASVSMVIRNPYVSQTSSVQEASAQQDAMPLLRPPKALLLLQTASGPDVLLLPSIREHPYLYPSVPLQASS